MRHARLTPFAYVVISLVTLAGCSGDAGVGDPCDNSGNCSGDLQCVENVCQPPCIRATDCGDGYSCDAEGLCHLATGQPGDSCTSEVECAPGLSCQIDGTLDADGRLLASCATQNTGRPAGSQCASDGDCRNGTCALGHCVDLCNENRDCAAGQACMSVPRVDAPTPGALFDGCLLANGDLVWTIPVSAPTANVLFPVPGLAHSASLVFTVDDPAQKVGAQTLLSPPPQETQLYTKPCEPLSATCTQAVQNAQYYGNLVRHMPELAQAVMALPSTPLAPLTAGAYRVRVSSFRSNGTPGSAIPHITAIVRMDTAVVLDLHFYFLDLDDHPCATAFGDSRLDATTAQTLPAFQSTYLTRLKDIFTQGAGIALGNVTYKDVLDHHDLDGLDLVDAGSLLALGEHATGLNIFFVRTLSPVGVQALAPNPGPAGLAKTRQSGIAISVDTLCYRDWNDLARLTAHEIARYMGLFHNVEHTVDPMTSAPWTDKIPDSNDSPNNLMFYSEFGGTELSPGQRDVLLRSGVLR
jgi:hypothetical protein